MKFFRAISNFFVWLCMFFILALMLMMFAEVFLRTLFNSSIIGATEWASMLLLFELTAMGASILSNRMIKVNMVTQKLPEKAQVILEIVTLTLSFAVIGFVSWRTFMYSITSYGNHVSYTTIKLPQWPFIALFAVAYGVAALTALAVIIRKIINACHGKWALEVALEDMDPIFVFGKHLPPKIQALLNGEDPKEEKPEVIESAEKPADTCDKEGGAE